MKLVLKNVRLSFPSLYVTEQYGGEDTGKFAATFLLDKDDPQVDIIKAAMKASAEGEFGTPLPKGIGNCLKDGDEKTYAGYENCFSIKASTKRRPVLIDGAKTPVVESDDMFYAGCYVNASLDIWTMNNQYGKKVLASLNGIQFAKDGESFGGSNDSLGDFDELEAAPAGELDDPFA